MAPWSLIRRSQGVHGRNSPMKHDLGSITALAVEVGTTCFNNGIFLDGCGCCGTLTYNGVEFDTFTVGGDGAVSGSALVDLGTGVMERLNFGFKLEKA